MQTCYCVCVTIIITVSYFNLTSNAAKNKAAYRIVWEIPSRDVNPVMISTVMCGRNDVWLPEKKIDIGAEDDEDTDSQMQKVRVPLVKVMGGRMQREVSMIRQLWKMSTWHLTKLKPAKISGKSKTTTWMKTCLLF